ncbi:MAG: phosphotransferase family protein [Solirubrobacteraceae bacterium]
MATLDDADVVRTAREAAKLRRAPLLVLDALERWLDQRRIGSGPVSATLLDGGHSNLSFRIRRAGVDAVLRRPPRPPLPPGAHDIVREARLLSGLEGSDVPAPRVIAICEGQSVIGAPFALTEFIAGYVLEHTLPPLLHAVSDQRRAGESFIDALAAVHAVDVPATGLQWLGRPGGYLERQLRRFSGSWEINRTRELPAINELERRLRATLPRSSETTLVHGDARLGNAIFAPDPPARVAALLDWEMATLGDPLADLGYLNAAWTDPGQTDPPMFHLSTLTVAAGFPTRTELIRRYEQRSRREVSDLHWYTALACWKSAIFMEGNYRRAMTGGSDDAFALGFRPGVEELAEIGLAELGR